MHSRLALPLLSQPISCPFKTKSVICFSFSWIDHEDFLSFSFFYTVGFLTSTFLSSSPIWHYSSSFIPCTSFLKTYPSILTQPSDPLPSSIFPLASPPTFYLSSCLCARACLSIVLVIISDFQRNIWIARGICPVQSLPQHLKDDDQFWLFFFILALAIIFTVFLSPINHVMPPHPPCSDVK